MSGIILERQGSETIHALVIKVKLREGNYLSRVTHLEWTSAVIVAACIGLLVGARVELQVSQRNLDLHVSF